LSSPAIDVVFDLDGTLVDSVSHCTEIMNQMLAERGSARRLTLEQARPHITLGGVKMVTALFAEACGDPEREIAEFRARYASMPTPPSSLFAGVREGLATLDNWGMRLSVCSNKPQPLCEKVLADLGLSDFIHTVVGSQDSLPLKPHPALFDKTMALTGGSRTRSCYVGDAEVDHELARRMDVPYVHVTYGYARPEWACETSLKADRFSEVPEKILCALNGLVPPVHSG
jgi:phosphoglycolate phosphatase